MNLDVGATVGDYQIVGILGAGGMGKVYKVRNLISDRIEAMKVLLPDLVQEPDLADRFLREIKVQASLEHPNIAALHTAVRVENQLLMLIEFVEGVTLEQKLKSGPLPAAQAVDYIRQVLAALEYAHARGVVHRDIKPANMMLTPGGVVKLMDFGIAKSAVDRRLTMTGTTMGSLYYMSPEQIQGATTVDARSDLYSVGVSLYELATGKRPFDGDSQFAIMSAHLEKTPVPPIEIDPRLPAALNDVILMSVLKDPNARFQTAAAFRNALGNVPFAAAQPAPAVAPAATIAAPPRGRRGLWMAIGAVAAMLAIIGIIQFGPRLRTKAAPQTTTTTAPAPAPAPPAPQQPTHPQPQLPRQPQPELNTPPAPKPVRQAEQQPAKQQRPPVAPPVEQRPAAPEVNAATPPAPQPQKQAAAPATPPPASAAEIEKAREQWMMLNVRATGIRGTLQGMQANQAARGLNLNAKFQEPAHLMDNYLQAADSALNEGNVALAKGYMEKAERQIERLEKDLNR